MIIYFFTAIISLACIYFGLKYKAKSKWLGRLLIVIGILLPCLLAAVRSVKIGTDTNGYISHSFELARKTDGLKEYFSVAESWYEISDPLYVLCNYLMAHIFNNFQIFLFIMELLVIVPIFVALNKSKKTDKEVLLGMALFFLFEYNVTFNMLRQGIAISFVILVIHYLVSGKKLKSLACLLVAIGFHKTAVICLPLLLIYWLLNKVKTRYKKMASAIIYMLIVAFAVFFEAIVMFLYNMGIYTHGVAFLNRYSISFDFSIVDTATYLIAIIVYWMSLRYIDKDRKNHDFYMILGVGGLVLLSLGWRVMFLERVSFYLFYPFLLYAVPKIVQNENNLEAKKRKKLSGYVFALILYFIIYWVVEFAIFNTHNTVPYEFACLGVV